MPSKKHPSAGAKRPRTKLWQMALPGIVLILVGLILTVKAYRASVPSEAGSAVSIKTATEVADATPNIFLDAVTNEPKKVTPVANVAPEAQLDQHLAAGRPVLAFFHSNDCVQCVKMIAVVEQVYPDFADTVALVDVNVYDHQNQNLLRRAGIRAIPTMIFIDADGHGQGVIGLMEPDAFRNQLQQISGE
ncbi:MAG: thioredoxin [Chloroflexi bacterium]|nr:MAG: thioredoxin [Chloroflexota bacterium]